MAKQNDVSERLARLEKHVELIESYYSRAYWANIDRLYRLSLPDTVIHCIVCDFSQEWGAWKKRLDTCKFGGGELERYECPKCECVFGAQKYLDLDEAFVDLDYQLLYAKYSESDSTENEIRTFQSLDPLKEGPYLDWGCGGVWSKTISTLRSQSYDVWGYEPSAQTSSEFVVNDRGLITAQFNGIFSNNVIEHFRDPVAQFRDFHTILKPGGVMAHSSPCYEWSYAFTRFHTLFLLGKSPYVLAERTGFQIKDRIQEGEYINYVYVRT